MNGAMAAGDMVKTAASVLSVDPPIIYVRPRPVPFGLAGLLAARSDRPMTCIVRTMWTLETEHQLMELLFVHEAFAARHPHVRIIVCANTEKELALLEEAGVETVLANHNMFVDDTLFRPLPNVGRTYDAVYNANFSAFKRRELCAEIESCVHLAYVADPAARGNMAAELHRAQAMLPRHVFLNPLSGNQVMRLPPRQVNKVLATAHVGLCLSEVEGPMVACMEYLLAGLPVVTTPNIGGRDRYLTPETSITADPNPRAIREAVAALKARAIPPAVVRQRTLDLVERDRRSFNDFIAGLREGHPPIAGDPRWCFSYVNNLYQWGRVGDFALALGLPLLDEEAGQGATAPWYADPSDT